ncbi:trafficking protein particle complex subunit 2-like protein [Phlebotomus argentipes]|uniref:trafficking protein particle complex subunit 2-like protein n=1 Tax=Phlebotomus argentipes TaxID=94469 RepID=UPI002892D82F|nr:trafficking protein particle complex subunit 2-like protein [Phlebotomus argentipes]
MSSNITSVCIAIIGKDNSPLFIATTDLDRELELHYSVHASLDIIEEKCMPASGKQSVDSRDLYLGMLYSTETDKIYGYVTNTKTKFIIVIDSGNSALRENEVRSMFRNLHILYTDAICNPFYTPEEPLTSKAFDRSVRNIMSGNV